MEASMLHIRAKAEDVLQVKVDDVVRVVNVPNNVVYRILVGDQSYIFKTYRQNDWPEDGKLAFINRKLIEHQIPCARLYAFDRSDSRFPTGYLLEECLRGVTADRIAYREGSGKEFYAKLADLVSQVHRIPIENYGYIGSGIANSRSFMGCMSDKLEEITKNLMAKRAFDKDSLVEIKEQVMDRLRSCDSLPSVLNHGDLSTKNVMVDERGELALIDWDDAMAYNWVADIARMTYWMKFHYDEYDYAVYRNAFMEQYANGSSVRDFDVLENTFHVWIGLDHLDYFYGHSRYDGTMEYVKETIDLW